MPVGIDAMREMFTSEDRPALNICGLCVLRRVGLLLNISIGIRQRKGLWPGVVGTGYVDFISCQ